MISRAPRGDDQDYLHLDNLIALADDIRVLVEEIKDTSDNPDVLLRALRIEAAALIIQRRSIDYRPRLKSLKKQAKRKKLSP